MKNLTILVMVLVCSIGARANTYSTSFPANENPISESGKWVNNSGFWGLLQTSGGHAINTIVNYVPAGTYNDSTAILTGAWASTQQICGTVWIDPAWTGRNDANHELELNVHATMGPGTVHLYNFGYSVRTDNAYAGGGRWDGENVFTGIGGSTGGNAYPSPGALQTGDVICVYVTSGGAFSWTLTRGGVTTNMPIDGSGALTETDATYLTGNPGIGMWERNSTADASHYGWSHIDASDSGGGGGGGGTVHNSPDCTLANVQATINGPTVHAGDTVTLPACSATSWASALTLNVPITVQGAGIGQTNIVMGIAAPIVEENHLIHFTAANAGGMRITGISFTNLGYCHRAILADGDSGYSNPPFRIDHNSFTGGADASCPGNGAAGLVDIFSTAGLVDHNDFPTADNAEDIHNYGDGQAGWAEDVTIGGANMLIVENNTFEDSNLGNTNFLGNSAIQSYNGSRLTFRYNTLTASQVDEHGTAGFIGARWYEIYNNAFVRTTQLQDKYMDLRAGSGVVYNNTESGTAGNPTIVFREEDTGTWPLAYQVGSGINGGTNGHAVCGALNSSPSYTWNNVGMQVTVPLPSQTITVQNRDYFVLTSAPATIAAQQLSTDTCGTLYTYVPYTYPDPLIGGQTFAPNVNLNPPSLTFGAQNVGTSSASQTVTLLNNGNATLTLNSILTGGDFSLTSTCGSTLAQNATCAIVVTFTPIGGGTRNGAVAITDNNQNIVNSQQVIALTGTGLVLGPLPPSGTVFQGVVNGGMVTH